MQNSMYSSSNVNMEENTRINILMSVYNGERYIDDQLESIYKQTVLNQVKLFIRDDGSSDRTIEIIKAWKDRLDITLLTGENLGPAKSFFELLKKSGDADFYSFCDQDDYWLENKLERAIYNIKQVDVNEKTPVLFYSNAECVDQNLQSMGKNIHQTIPLYNYANILSGNSAIGCTMVMNKALRDIICSLEIQHCSMHDKKAILVASLLGNVVYDFQPTMLYRQHANNVTRSSGQIMKRISLIYKRWFKNKNNSIALQAEEHLKYFHGDMKEEDKYYAELFASYKTNIKSRLKLIFDKEMTCSNPKFTRTFKIRVILGLA